MLFPRCTGRFHARCGPACIPAGRKKLSRSGTSQTAFTFRPGLRRRCPSSTTGTSARAGQEHSGESGLWERIENIDDGELWETHLSLKARLLEFVRRSAVEQAERRKESAEFLQKLGRALSPDALTIGFARRFATYKRANLILKEFEQLLLMVNDPKRPVQFVFAGKAHRIGCARESDTAADCSADAFQQLFRPADFR